LFQNEAQLNPQGWAAHNNDDVPKIKKEKIATIGGVAMLPSLLVLNPRARGVFENLEHFANPQFIPGLTKFTSYPNIRRTIRRHPTLTRPRKRTLRSI
jgi:hypothetical protein